LCPKYYCGHLEFMWILWDPLMLSREELVVSIIDNSGIRFGWPWPV
jgi:hypothetical protein